MRGLKGLTLVTSAVVVWQVALAGQAVVKNRADIMKRLDEISTTLQTGLPEFF